jgi:hypothetical protein
MRKIIFPSLIFLEFCSPYQPYHETHYNIKADIDPESGMFHVDLQMVYVPMVNHPDSIEFHLDKGFSITGLAAQELVHYTFDNGRLVFHLEEPVMKGDQLHISVSYSGTPGSLHEPGGNNLVIDSSLNWFPVNRHIPLMTYRLRIGLPKPYLLDGTGGNHKSMNTYSIEDRGSLFSIQLSIRKNAV